TYYIGYVFAYVEAVATWEFGLKALFACFDKHFGRLLIFNACDAVLGAVFVSIPRPVYRVGYDWVWPMITFLWFSVYAYTAEMSVRTTFIRKCELYIARSASEEVSRLHRFVLDATRDVVIVHSVDASARTLYVSRACHNLLGYSQREMLDRSLIELVHPGDLAKARQLLFGMGDSEGVNLAAQGEAGGKYAPPTGGAFDVGPPTTSPSEQNQAVDAFVPCAATNDRVSSFAGWPSPSDVRTVINPVERLPSMNAADTLLAAAAAAAQDSAAAMDALCHPATVHAVELEIPPLEDGGASVSVTSVAGDGVGGNTSAAHTTTLLSVQTHAAPATSNLSTGALPSDAAAVEAWPNVRSAPFARFAAHPATTETGDSSAPPLSPTNGERSSLAPALHGPPHSADSAFMVAPSTDGRLGDHSSMPSVVSAPAPRTPVLSATLDTLAQPSAPLPMLSHHASNAPPSVRGDAVAASSGADVAHAAVLSLSARKMSSTASSTTDPNSSVSVQPALALQPESPPSAQRFTALPDARPGASRAAVYAGRSQPRLTGHPHALQHFQGGSLWSPSVITENLRESDDEENDDPRIAARAEETRGLAPAGLMLAAALEAGVN
ncbi:PAS domain S-box protein, partial [archaeon]